jgi:rSAM/selenodomain-associated transferase 2
MSISVIIPTLNEAAHIAETLRCVRAEKPREILVVDGGSSDATCELAREADCVLQGPRGRAAQMNLGAEHAAGDVLLFLHADCTLEAGALYAAEECLGRRGVAAGCFRMTVTAPGPVYRLLDACATARVRLTGMIYGDQGLFVKRQVFERIGGFPPLMLMEDLFFSKQLRRQGRIVVAPRCIFVSPRRWQQQGIVRPTLLNWTLTALAAAGVPPNRLAAFYPMVR